MWGIRKILKKHLRIAAFVAAVAPFGDELVRRHSLSAPVAIGCIMQGRGWTWRGLVTALPDHANAAISVKIAPSNDAI